MEKRHFITVSLLVTALAANPLFANRLNTSNPSSLRQANILTSQITSSLHKRGIDEDAANEISKIFTDGEENLDAKINNLLEVYQNISHEELLEHISIAALHRQKINFDSYDNLISMVSKIKGSNPNTNELQKLRTVSNINKVLC